MATNSQKRNLFIQYEYSAVFTAFYLKKTEYGGSGRGSGRGVRSGWDRVVVYAKRKAQISCEASAQLISALLRYLDRKIPLQPNPNFKPLTIVCVMQSGLCRTWSENPKTDAANIMSCSNKHWSLFTGDTCGHTMFSIIQPI